MFLVVIGIVGVQTFIRRRQAAEGAPQGRAGLAAAVLGGPVAGVVMILVGLAFLESTSFALISADRVGQLQRIYLAADLPPGRIIALPGQKGP